MNTRQIKTDLINAINQTNNPVLLMEMGKLIDIDQKDEGIIKLTNDQIAELELAIAQIEKGDYYTHEEAKKLANEWLED